MGVVRYSVAPLVALVVRLRIVSVTCFLLLCRLPKNAQNVFLSLVSRRSMVTQVETAKIDVMPMVNSGGDYVTSKRYEIDRFA